MKKAEIFLYGLYAAGIVIKLFKLPMHTIFIMVILLILSIYYTFCLVRKKKDILSILTGYLTVLWLFCFLSFLKHFSFLNIVWILSIASAAIVLLVLVKHKKVISANSILCAFIITLTVFIRFVPACHTYYVTNIKFNYEIERDYFSWDKYSWFLYKEGKYDEAAKANENARTAVERGLQNPRYGDESEYLTLITKHQLAIQDKTWEEYP